MSFEIIQVIVLLILNIQKLTTLIRDGKNVKKKKKKKRDSESSRIRSLYTADSLLIWFHSRKNLFGRKRN